MDYFVLGFLIAIQSPTFVSLSHTFLISKTIENPVKFRPTDHRASNKLLRLNPNQPAYCEPHSTEIDIEIDRV